MSSIINKIIKHRWMAPLMKKWYVIDSICYPIVKHPKAVFDTYYHIKDASWESMVMPEVWTLSKKYDFTMYHEAQDILRIPNASVTQNSDVVLTENGAVWDKYESPMFNYMYAMDKNVTKYNNESVYIRKPKHTIQIEGECISMLGVFEDIWAHFITQFLPKLYYAEEAGLLDKDITVILPQYTDSNIQELVDNVFDRHPASKKYVIPQQNGKRYAYQCETLYWIPTAAALSNDTIIPMLYQNIIPQKVQNILRKKAFAAYTANNKSSEYEKIYLVRKGSYRNLTNIDEVEDFFRKAGFKFVEPHTLTISQKINIFGQAKIVVGPHSSAWTNALFCKQAKGIMFTPISWLGDAYIGYNIHEDECEILMVPGQEIYYTSSHNPYYIPLDDIKEAYEHIIRHKGNEE